jgi:hypothetical protein
VNTISIISLCILSASATATIFSLLIHVQLCEWREREHKQWLRACKAEAELAWFKSKAAPIVSVIDPGGTGDYVSPPHQFDGTEAFGGGSNAEVKQ